jgi:hypothetical protein
LGVEVFCMFGFFLRVGILFAFILWLHGCFARFYLARFINLSFINMSLIKVSILK